MLQKLANEKETEGTKGAGGQAGTDGTEGIKEAKGAEGPKGTMGQEWHRAVLMTQGGGVGWCWRISKF